MREADEAPAPPGRANGWLASFPARFQRKISQGAYRPEIDGLRFFAIAFVILGHSLERAARFFPSYQTTLAGGAVETYLQLAPLGVSLFFAISGFILASQAMKANASPLSSAFLKTYFGRRVMRIEPPYILLLIATWLLIRFTGYVPEGTHKFDVEPQSLDLSLVGSLIYAHDLVWGTFPRLFPPGWSLEVEVQFYILAPLLFWLWARLKPARARAAMAAIFLGVGVILSYWHFDTLGSVHVGYSLLRYFNFFWIGIVMAYAKDGLVARIAAWPRAAVTAIGWLGLAFAIALPGDETLGFGGEALRLLGVYLGLMCAFASALAPNSSFRAFCARPWISLIGGACYSIYLVHLQVLQVAASLLFKLAPQLLLIGVAAALVLSWVVVVAVGLIYYVQIERRFMTRNWHLLVLTNLRQWAARGGAPHPAAEP